MARDADYQEADTAGPFCASPRLAHPGRVTTPGPNSGHLARVLWQTDSRPRIALLQSLVGINQDHVRMTTGSGPLIYRPRLAHGPPPVRTAASGSDERFTGHNGALTLG
jgi:hypothetical protein